MSFALYLTQSQIMTALRSVLLAILPSGVAVIQAQDNLVPEPAGSDFVVMTPLMRTRLETNVDAYADAAFTGSVAGTTLTVSAVRLGAITVGATMYAPVVGAVGTILQQLGGTTGGAGTYKLSQSATLSSGPMAAGTMSMMQPTELTVQLDVHGVTGSADNAQIISTLFRSHQAATLFAAQGYDVTPMWASDPRQTPFINAEQQVERMLSVDVHLQANQIVGTQQQFADVVTVNPHAPADNI